MRFGKRLEVAGKRITTSVFSRVLGGRSVSVDAPRLSDVRKILFVRPNFRMGNMLLATPGLHAARVALPQAKIGFLTTSAYVQLLKGHPDIDRLHVLDRGMIAGIVRLFRLVRDIRGARYDLVVDCSEGASLLGAAFVGLSGARYRLGLNGSKQQAFFNLRMPVGRHSTHKISRQLELLSRIGIRAPACPMKIALGSEELKWARKRWESWKVGTGQKCIGINIGARGDKRWPIERFLEVIATLNDQGERVVVFAGPQELDRLAEMERRIPCEVIIDTTNYACRFAALLSFCSVFVTGDTGPMHLAVAVGTPTVAIFRKNNFMEYGPQGRKHRTLYSETEVGVGDLLVAVNDLIGAPYGALNSSNSRRMEYVQ